ncbi:UNVERIFIED_CONTAM: hypothetical protein Sradi_6356500, partial [Sesamum radiatum]
RIGAITDVTKLPLINVEDHPNLPTEVQAFMDQILLADAILFSAPEYNYSVTRNKPQTLISYSFLNAICTQTFDYDVPSTYVLSLWCLMEYRTYQLLLKMQLIGYPRGQKLWLVKLLQSSARDGILVGAECSQIGVRPDFHFINTPEVFVSTTVDAQHPPKFDANGDLIDDNVRAQLQQLLVSLRDFTLPLKYGNKANKDSGILT